MKNSLPIFLLVCKDASKVSFFKTSLKKTFDVIQTEDCESALEWVKSTPIEIVLLDEKALSIPLEKMCDSIQKASKEKHTPILLLSNSLKKSVVLNALNAGISDFLHEPLQELEVHERIAVSLRSKLINKKMKLLTRKIKSSPLIPKNTDTFSERTLIREKTLKAITEARKGAPPLSVLMIHLDSLSRLQKNFGADGIKEIVLALGSFLQKRLRKYDTLLIEGTGQYLILLPKTSQSAARVMAEDICKEISTTTISTSIREVLVTVSIGLVSFEKELSKSAKAFEQFDECLKRIKNSLLQSKKKGNTIILDSKKDIL